MCKLQGSWHVISGSHLAENVLHNKCESGDQFEKAGRPLLSNLSCFSRVLFPFLCFPMPLIPSTALRRLGNDSDSDVFQ